MGKLKAYFFLVIVFLFTFSQGVVVLSFLSNQNFIVENLCENRDRPELKCNGKCFLMKKLKEGEDQKNPEQIAGQEIIFFMSTPIEIITAQNQLCTGPKTWALTDQLLLDGFKGAVFHPPSLAI